MTAGPVEWGAHAGMLERVAAVLVAQEQPHVIRRTPSSGDGGVDLLVPTEAGWHVLQVKGFTGRVDASRKRQIADSLQEVRRNPRLNGRLVAEWSLVVPIDPTAGEQAWFEDLTLDCEFPCFWDGEPWWNSMAAKHPHVIDYYFRDGRERIARRIKAMDRASDLLDRPPTALDVGTTLDVMRRALDKEDPHYRYQFHMGDIPGAEAARPEGAVMMSSHPCDDGQYWTVFVIPKHNLSLEEAPIFGTMTITGFDSAKGIDIRDQLDDFRDYGRPLDIPDGALAIELNAPGGLWVQFEAGGGSIAALPSERGIKVSRLRLEEPDGTVLHELPVRTTSLTQGESGGIEFTAEDGSGLLRLRVRISPPGETGRSILWNLSLDEFAGQPIKVALPLVRFMASSRAGLVLRWMEEHGSTTYALHIFAADEGSSSYDDDLLQVLDDLSIVQDKVRGTVVVPAEFDQDELSELRATATMIRDGEVRGTWTGGTFHLQPDTDRRPLEDLFRAGGQLLQSGPMVLQVGDRTYDLGPGYHQYVHAVLAAHQPLDDRLLAVEPGADPTTVQRLGTLPGK